MMCNRTIHFYGNPKNYLSHGNQTERGGGGVRDWVNRGDMSEGELGEGEITTSMYHSV